MQGFILEIGVRIRELRELVNGREGQLGLLVNIFLLFFCFFWKLSFLEFYFFVCVCVYMCMRVSISVYVWVCVIRFWFLRLWSQFFFFLIWFRMGFLVEFRVRRLRCLGLIVGLFIVSSEELIYFCRIICLLSVIDCLVIYGLKFIVFIINFFFGFRSSFFVEIFFDGLCQVLWDGCIQFFVRNFFGWEGYFCCWRFILVLGFVLQVG